MLYRSVGLSTATFPMLLSSNAQLLSANRYALTRVEGGHMAEDRTIE